MTRYGYRIPAMNEKRWNFTGINKSWWCSTNVSQFFLFLVTWICWDLAGASWLTLQRAKLGGHLSSQVPSSLCWIHPFQVEEISPYPNLWLHSRFIFLDWLYLNFEEIVNRKRLTEQHFFYPPNSKCSHPFGSLLMRVQTFIKRDTEPWWDIIFVILLLEMDRDHTQSYI